MNLFTRYSRASLKLIEQARQLFKGLPPTNPQLSLLAQSVFGTLDYAPPEQQGFSQYGKPSAKSDVFALGKTLYRLLTGEMPHTLHPRRLAEAPALFELLCDCVEMVPEKRLNCLFINGFFERNWLLFGKF
mgnify:CR=1 FL=1